MCRSARCSPWPTTPPRERFIQVKRCFPLPSVCEGFLRLFARPDLPVRLPVYPLVAGGGGCSRCPGNAAVLNDAPFTEAMANPRRPPFSEPAAGAQAQASRRPIY